MGCVVVVVNWGTMSGEDYLCLCYSYIKLIGQLLGNMFYLFFNLSKLYLAGHSLGGHIFAWACDTVINSGSIVYEITGTFWKILLFCTNVVYFKYEWNFRFFFPQTVLDLAGFLFKNSNFPIELFENIMRPNIATRTIAIYTNPYFMGNANFSTALINIIVNSPLFFQPGYFLNLGFINPFYNHAFAVALYAAFCANVQCLVNLFENVNSIYNESLQPGTYYLYLLKCYPFCC